MGVDYSGVGGIGIKLDSEIIDQIINSGRFNREEWEEDECGCVECLRIPYYQAGNSYSGDVYYYLMVDGDTLGEINSNAQLFCDKLSKLGVIIDVNSLSVVDDVNIW